MNSIKMISAAAILSAAIATPVLAQGVGTNGRHAIAHQQTFYRSYNADPIFSAPPAYQ
jgi:multisubunit Na+/H+ antiporter MnhC subunit